MFGEGGRTQNIIPGYTGHLPSHELEEDILQINQAKSHIPGYAGYIPGKRSENLYGKTYGRTTFLSSTKTHHRGADVPPELRYVSTIQDEFKDQREVKVYELDRLKVIEEAKKTAGQFYGKEVMGYSSFDKSTLPLLTGSYQERPGNNRNINIKQLPPNTPVPEPQPIVNLTYEEARNKAFAQH